jgi:pimeloyl-ACP methyl ester carboxylesterase
VVPEVGRQHRFDIYSDRAPGRLEAQWIGPEPDRGPTLIFLHEGLGCVALWREFPVRLVRMSGLGALVYSRLGYGGSDPCSLPRSVDFMHHEGLNVLPEIIERCGIGDYVLIGHSDGGSIALIHAGGNPGPGLKGVITLAAHVFCEDLTRQSIEAARRRFLSGSLEALLIRYHGENTHCAFWGWNDVWLHPDFKRWNIENFLPAIRVPLLAIQGERDPYGTMAQVDAIKSRAGSSVTLERIDGCGHAPHVEKTETVANAINRFLHSLDANPP